MDSYDALDVHLRATEAKTVFDRRSRRRRPPEAPRRARFDAARVKDADAIAPLTSVDTRRFGLALGAGFDVS